MTGKRPPPQILEQRLAYDSPWIRLWVARVLLPDGTVIPQYHLLDYPKEAVCVVPVGDDGRVLMVYQYRLVPQCYDWEVPAGAIETVESAEAAARRELAEEAGATASELIYLGRYNPSNGTSNQVFHIFVGRHALVVGAPADPNEIEKVGWFQRAEIRQMIRSNALKDGLTLTALLWAMQEDHL
jgi:8-oxo-dGTP pyrophosphatase MutT (NUDIX family)